MEVGLTHNGGTQKPELLRVSSAHWLAEFGRLQWVDHFREL